MKWAFCCAVIVCVNLVACAKYPQIALVAFERETFSVKIAQDSYMLYVAHNSPNVYHFALFDSLGVPIADKILQNGNFRDTKLLPPSAKYNEIFVESLRLLESGKSRKIAESYEILRVKNE